MTLNGGMRNHKRRNPDQLLSATPKIKKSWVKLNQNTQKKQTTSEIQHNKHKHLSHVIIGKPKKQMGVTAAKGSQKRFGCPHD